MTKTLDVFAITTTGQLKHTTRNEVNGKWQTFFGDVEQTIGKEVAHFIDVSVKKQNAGSLEVCLIDSSNSCYYAYRKSVDKTSSVSLLTLVLGSNKQTENWSIYKPISLFPKLNFKKVITTDIYTFAMYDNNDGKGKIDTYLIASGGKYNVPTNPLNTIPFPSNCPFFVDFDMSVAKNGDYNFALADVNGNLYFAIKPRSSDFVTLQSTILNLPNNEKCVKVSCCFSINDLHLVVVSNTGNIYHTIYNKQNYFGDIQTVCGRVGSFNDISCADIDGVLHIVGTTIDGKLLHTLRKSDGSWQKTFGNIETQSGEAGSYVAVAISSKSVA